MERLTEVRESGGAWPKKGWTDIVIADCLDRLAAIENILGDEYDLEDLNKALWCKRVVEDAFSDDTSSVERLRKLWFADQKGHCVVFDEHYPVVSEYYRDEEGRYIRESSGVISEAEYKAAMGKGD